MRVLIRRQLDCSTSCSSVGMQSYFRRSTAALPSHMVPYETERIPENYKAITLAN